MENPQQQPFVCYNSGFKEKFSLVLFLWVQKHHNVSVNASYRTAKHADMDVVRW